MSSERSRISWKGRNRFSPVAAARLPHQTSVKKREKGTHLFSTAAVKAKDNEQLRAALLGLHGQLTATLIGGIAQAYGHDQNRVWSSIL